MLPEGPSLAAVWFELVYRQTNGDASLAMLAAWAVGKVAAAPEALPNQFAIYLRGNELLRRGNQALRAPVGQVAARVGRGHIELQLLYRRFVWQHHTREALNKPHVAATTALWDEMQKRRRSEWSFPSQGG